MRSTNEETDFVLPVGCVECPYCGKAVDVNRGLAVMEELWMHEYECEGIELSTELAA
jgi:hypothetical protein